MLYLIASSKNFFIRTWAWAMTSSSVAPSAPIARSGIKPLYMLVSRFKMNTMG